MDRGVVINGFINLILVVIALVVLYYSFKFFYGTSTEQGVTLISNRLTANQGVKVFTNQARIYEGGEYTVNFWMYIGGYKQNQGTRKHVFEIGGANFSTLLVALGAFKNSLSVRVHTKAGPGFTDASGRSMDASGNPLMPVTGSITQSTSDMSLTPADKAQLFKPLMMDDGLLNTAAGCDIEMVDLQRWVQVSIVLNGRTSDVYVDGKLARSCILKSFYRVDPTGVSVKVADNGGFDGSLSQVSTYNSCLRPDIIYKMYMAGPNGSALDPIAYMRSLFQKQQ